MVHSLSTYTNICLIFLFKENVCEKRKVFSIEDIFKIIQWGKYIYRKVFMKGGFIEFNKS